MTPAVDFRDGSTLTEADLDLAVTQLLYIAQEAYDALDGETAVAAKDKAEKILKEVEEVFAKTQIENQLLPQDVDRRAGVPHRARSRRI